MSHSFFSPSKGAMWMECAGSLAMRENQEGETSSTYADDGTASHTLAAWALETGKNCHEYPHESIFVNGIAYSIDEERTDRVQVYVDDVRRSGLGGIVWSEHRVDLSKYLGMAVCETCNGACYVQEGGTGVKCPTCDGDGEVPQGGTSDAVIILPEAETLIVGDLKDGAGEKVYASYFAEDGKTRKINHQIGLYALGVLEDVLLLGHKITRVLVRIYQPRLNHLDEFEISVEDLLGEFATRVRMAAALNGDAMVLPVNELDAKGYLKPGLKTCRWCRAAARCPAMRRFVQEQTKREFSDESDTPLEVPESTEHLSQAVRALPLIQQWVKATNSAIWKAVNEGREVIGPDGKPMKIVEGEEGKRQWNPEKLLSGEVEGLLAGQLGPKAYEPQKPITAPAAAKLLDRKATKALWKDVFMPLIKRAKGAPQLALGSDTRPPYGARAAAEASEFDDIGVSE